MASKESPSVGLNVPAGRKNLSRAKIVHCKDRMRVIVQLAYNQYTRCYKYEDCVDSNEIMWRRWERKTRTHELQVMTPTFTPRTLSLKPAYL